MREKTSVFLAAAGGLLAAWVGWGLYVDRTTERAPSETLETFDGVELRRYPRTVLVETTADDENEAFGRLFRYISGANEGGDEVAMTAPVVTQGSGSKVAMTAPVRTTPDSEDGAVTMAFYLPVEYEPGNAPTPTDPRVRLVVEPPQTVAVRPFSWYATDGRVERNLRDLRDALEARNLEPLARPVLLRYDDPWTPPFMRRNEVAVEVESEE